MHEWILPVLNIIIIIAIFVVSERNRQHKFGIYDFFADKSGGLRFAQERSTFAADRGVIYLLWSASCGHCQMLKDPAKGGRWPLFVKRAQTAGLTVKEIEMTSDMSLADQAIVEKIGSIPGVPYIVRLASDGKPEAYQGARDDESLMSWALRV